MQMTFGFQVSRSLRLMGGTIVLMLLGACAHHHPKKEVPSLPLPPPAPSAQQLEQANNELQQCLHLRAYALDNGRSSPGQLGGAVADGCLPQLHLLAVLEARRTHDRTGAYVLYRSRMNSASALGAQAIQEFRESRVAAR